MKFILFFLFASFFFLAGCSVRYPVVGSFNDYNEVFYGAVDSDLLAGTSYIHVEGEISKMKCTGGSRVTYIPPISYIIPVCKGQRGIAEIKCTDGRIVHADWEATSCTSGIGSGYDQKGNKLTFAFGQSESEAKSFVDNELKQTSKRPDLPPIYKPKEFRKDKGYSTGTGFFISDNGYLITNYHVVEDSNEMTIIMKNGETKVAKYIKGDRANDVVLLKVEWKGIPLKLNDNSNRACSILLFSYNYR